MKNYQIGQKYFSLHAHDLGVGEVTAVEGHLITLFFADVADFQSYHPKSAPLQRARLSIGQEFMVKGQNKIFKLEKEVSPFVYQAHTGEIFQESEIHFQLQNMSFHAKVSGLHVDNHHLHALNTIAHKLKRKWAQYPYKGLYGSRIAWLPHQISTFYKVVELFREKNPKPLRLILADEVGLGKTITSLWILSHLKKIGVIQRALILTPDALEYQWYFEIFEKFDLKFKTFGDNQVSSFDKDDQDSNDFLMISRSDLEINAMMLRDQGPFDMLIIDEAHQWPSLEDLSSFTHENSHYIFLSATLEAKGIEIEKSILSLINSSSQNVDTPLFMTKFRKEMLKENYEQNYFNKKIVKTYLKDHLEHDLIQLLESENYQENKFLIFTHKDEDAKKWHKTLSQKLNTECALFTGNLSRIERDKMSARFEDDINILISSEIGSEGRNFEFCHHLIMLDIPQHPTGMIQRIGRVDRIGQEQDINLHFFLNDDFEIALLKLYDKRLNLIQNLSQDIVNWWQEKGPKTQEDVLFLSQKESPIELHSTNNIEEIDFKELRPIAWSNIDRPDNLDFTELSQFQKFYLLALEQLGIEVKETRNSSYQALALGESQVDQIPGHDESVLNFTFDKSVAQKNKFIHYLTPDHDLMQSMLDAFTEDAIGSLSVVKTTQIDDPFVLEIHFNDSESGETKLCYLNPHLKKLNQFHTPSDLDYAAKRERKKVVQLLNQNRVFNKSLELINGEIQSMLIYLKQ